MRSSLFVRILTPVLAIILCICAFTACTVDEAPAPITITNGEEIEIRLGETVKLDTALAESVSPDTRVTFYVFGDCVTVSNDGTVTAVKVGTSTVSASAGDASDKIKINVIDPRELTLTIDTDTIEAGKSATLIPTISPAGSDGTVYYQILDDNSMNPYVRVANGKVTALRGGGEVRIVACLLGTNVQSEPITVKTLDAPVIPPESITLTIDKNELRLGEITELHYTVYPETATQLATIRITGGAEIIAINGNIISTKAAGRAVIVAEIGDVTSNEVVIDVTDEFVDPYENVDKAQFYANYKPATSYLDAYYRTQHGLMSGSITVPDAAPTISKYQPTKNGMLIRNTETLYSDGGKTYTVVDAYGNAVMKIYEDGAYITLEEVAAYVYAFGTYPANHNSKKSAKPSSSIWGEYLRVNHSYFSGDTSRYPYEPVLPNISGCGGDLQYYEMDVGTTGSGYSPTIYNNGTKITRGAARIVYAKQDLNRNGIYEENEHYLFYTYNHYNDFQEYLNYYGGWGEIFGNVTGGSTQNNYDPNHKPTQYPAVYWGAVGASAAEYAEFVAWVDYKRILCV